MKIWLDDERPMPPEYDTYCRTAEECVEHLRTGKVTHISLDNDLGACETEGRVVAIWIEKEAFHGRLQRLVCKAHTANEVAKSAMEYCFENANKYWNNSEASVRA